MGAWYGPVAYLWIIFGCIFAGAMHDYMSGMLSIRNEGAGLPELVGKYLGGRTKKVMLVFSVLLLMMVGEIRLGNNHQTARCHVETMDNTTMESWD